MRRLALVLAIVLGVLALGRSSAVADSEVRTVTAAVEGLIAGPTVLAGVSVASLEIGTGVFINPDGSAMGAFHAVLVGTSALGKPQQVTLEGNVTTGALTSGGQARFGGSATLNLGDGTAALLGVPFSVTAGADSLLLAVDVTTLPAAGVSAGAIAIE